uniref:Uncharacterized protein n=1 Tax=Oryza brachyantha TaxID=4533 RepID=J3MUI8_ORYBR
MAAPATDLHHTTTTAAAAAVDPYYYSNEVDNATDEDVIAAADRLLSMDIDEVAALIAIVQQGDHVYAGDLEEISYADAELRVVWSWNKFGCSTSNFLAIQSGGCQKKHYI